MIKTSSNKISLLMIATGIFALTFITLSPAMNNDFVNWDDNTYITNNDLIRSLHLNNIISMFKTPIMKIYTPLTTLTFAAEYHYFKLDPFIYHLDNLLLHLAIVLLIFWFSLQLGLNRLSAAFAALLFGIHPMHIESVAWATERKDVLYSFFYMLSLNFYLKYIDKKDLKLFILVIFLGFLSMLSKPMALSLPLILFLCDWLKRRKINAASIFEKLFIFIYIVPIAWITYHLHGLKYQTIFHEEALKTLWIFIFYILKFIFPSSLSMFYGLPEPATLFNFSYLVHIAVFTLLIISIFYFKKNRLFVFANLFYILTVFFALRRVIIHSPMGKPFYGIDDRFMYLPSLGYCVFIGFVLDKIIKNYKKTDFIKFTLAIVITAMIFLSLSLTSFIKCRQWRDSMTLWTAVIKVNPQAAIAYNNRGVRQKDKTLALNDFSKCIKIDPNFIEAYFNRAGLYNKMGKHDLAIKDYTSCISLDPGDSESYYLRSKSYYFIGDLSNALSDAKKAELLGYKVPNAYTSKLSKSLSTDY